MDVKYQIFVSSTFKDLEEERRKVIEMILNMGHIPVGMEAFQASDSTQWEYITRRIDESDYYAVIIAERYGSMENGKSYTQMEYEYAVSKGIPVAAFLLDETARKTWPLDKVDTDKRSKIEAFRKLSQKKLVKFWKNPDDLGAKVALALNELFKDRPRTGWVRADSVPSLHVIEEISRLSEEKRELQARVAELSDAGGLVIPPDVLYRIDQLQMTFPVFESANVEDELPSILDLFLGSHKVLATGCEPDQVQEYIRLRHNVFGTDDREAENILAEFAANDLVEVRFTVFGNIQRRVYFLTSYGKNFEMYATKWLVDQAVKSLV
ncbi:hypothetical protein GFPCMMHI_04971 [Ensifer adhaerens]|nr:hypothetical protein [Ensifer adhaerens]